MQNELQALAGKIGELEQEADEHTYAFDHLLRRVVRLTKCGLLASCSALSMKL